MDLTSVIIPAYNAEKYLAETIQSVLDQTYEQIELIVVNDGSTDNTEAVVKQFLPDERIKYIFQENSGVSAARNTGYAASNGKYLAFLDADDLYLPTCIEDKIKLLIKNPGIGLVHAGMAVINNAGQETGDVFVGKEGNILDDLLLWNGTCIPAPSSVLIRREVVEAVGCFDTELSTAADQEFFFRVANKFSIGRVNKVLGLYRVHGENMHQNISLMARDHTLAYRKAEQNKLFKSWKFKNRAFANLFLILAGSWWVDGRNKPKGFYYMLKAVGRNPFCVSRIVQKVLLK